MSNKQQTNNVASVATVAIPTTLRAIRVARIQVALHTKRITEKKQSYITKTLHAKQQAYMLQVQQLAAEYGLPLPNTLSVRNNSTAQKHAPSATAGACAQVHAIAAAHKGERKATLAACVVAGINPHTAATQYAKYRKANITN